MRPRWPGTPFSVSAPEPARFAAQWIRAWNGAPRMYWTLALQGNPNLHFALVGVYVGLFDTAR